ncbi:MAG: dTDP-4-dehydrorhamnose 3,5-epimerase [Acidimicrobiia bacterium]
MTVSAHPDVEQTAIAEVLVVAPKVHRDDRGSFSETYNQESFRTSTGLANRFVQDNESLSVGGTLRGIHYQVNGSAQGKLVRVVEGEVFDVAVDLRQSSDSFEQWVGVALSHSNGKQLWIPEGFGHAFLVLSDSARVLYKTTDYYDPSMARTIRWDDETIGIAWPETPFDITMSEGDAAGSLLADAEVFD